MKDKCEMRGFLNFIILRLIGKKPMSGDDIRNEIAKRRGAMPSPGTIYPVLKDLSESGLIQEIKSAGKMKKYQLTQNGRKMMKEATKKFVEIFYDMKEEFSKK